MYNILPFFIFTFSITLWLSFLILKFGKKWLIDFPSERKIHTIPIPRIGGIAIGLSFFISLLFYSFNIELLWYLTAFLILFILGIIDDYSSISWKIKLPIQLIVASIVINRFLGLITSISFFHITLNFPTIILIIIFLIWFVGILNAVNLIDGMDGLSGGFMVIITFSSIVIGILTENYNFVSLNSLLLGSLVGFLFFNRRPARYFMGDSGSLILGYHVACLPLIYHQFSSNSNVLEITPFLILSSFLIMDTTRVFFSRLLKGKNPMNADTIHLHHLVFKETKSYMGTLIPIFFVTLIGGISSILFFKYDFGYLGMQFFLLILILFIIIPPVPFYVPLTSKLNNFISSLKTSRFNDKYLFRVRFLIPLGILYLLILLFSKINKNNLDKIFLIEFNIFDLGLFIGFSFLLIFSLIRNHADESFQSRIVLVILIQSFLLFFLDGSNFSNESFYLRNIILIIMILITGVNYFQNSKHLGFEFWSVIDLLILILFIALVILKINGVQLRLFSILEILVFYYSLSLYAQRRHPRLKI
tara:strand:+ start:4101 stop:5696 length:1596 start_codon:yes stop_codon:yes gene_type:complete